VIVASTLTFIEVWENAIIGSSFIVKENKVQEEILEWKQVKGTYFKLQKDKKAYVRSSMDAARFVQGAISFQSTAKHLSLPDDDRTFGPTRIKKAPTFLVRVHDVI
jgi:hypothetical protein